MLDKGKELEWFDSPFIIGLAITAVVGFIAFLIWELTAAEPIVDLRVFRHRGFVLGVTALSLTFGTFFASIVLVPLWLQTTMSYTATTAGYAGSLNGALALIASPIIGRLMGKVDARAMVTFAVLWMAGVAYWRAHFTTDATFTLVALSYLAQGVATPMFFIPSTTIALSSVLPQETASAAGLANFLRTSAAAFATSLMTTAWDSTATVKRGLLVGRLHDVPATTALLGSLGLTPEQARGQVDALVERQSVMLATREMFMVSVFVFLLAGVLIWLAPAQRASSGAAAAAH
jgi:DHA2 family multidrug resistance protein